MVSTRAQENSDVAIRAMSLGALDCIDLKRFLGDPTKFGALTDTLRAAASAKVRGPRADDHVIPPPILGLSYVWNRKIVLIGSSTGGVDALGRILAEYPPDGPPTVITQHMPAAFLESFARRLDATVAPNVRLASDATPIGQGEVVLAAGGTSHLTVQRAGAEFRFVPIPDTGDTLHVPSVDILLKSAVGFGRTRIQLCRQRQNRRFACFVGFDHAKDPALLVTRRV